MGPLVLQNGDKRLILANNRFCRLGSWLRSVLKITEKVSFNMASEASYIYTRSEQKLVKNANDGQF